MITGLHTFSSRLPRLPATATAVSLPMTWMQTMIMASHWVGLTLPGMIDEPGSFGGSTSSPSPLRGPDPSQRMSSAILVSDTASVRRVALGCTRASWAASAANLLGAETNGSPVMCGDVAPPRESPNSGWALRPVPTAVPPRASS